MWFLTPSNQAAAKIDLAAYSSGRPQVEQRQNLRKNHFENPGGFTRWALPTRYKSRVILPSRQKGRNFTPVKPIYFRPLKKRDNYNCLHSIQNKLGSRAHLVLSSVSNFHQNIFRIWELVVAEYGNDWNDPRGQELAWIVPINNNPLGLPSMIGNYLTGVLNKFKSTIYNSFKPQISCQWSLGA